jgi:hypothetical protein
MLERASEGLPFFKGVFFFHKLFVNAVIPRDGSREFTRRNALHCPTDKNGAFCMNREWQIYRKLELISDSVKEPQVSKSVIVAKLSEIKQTLTKRSMQKLSYERQIQHLEQCLELADTLTTDDKKPSIWRTLWVFLNQPIFESKGWTTAEPKVERVSDQGGHVWWYVYDPQTRQTVYLESENEVLVWLEEHLSR